MSAVQNETLTNKPLSHYHVGQVVPVYVHMYFCLDIVQHPLLWGFNAEGTQTGNGPQSPLPHSVPRAAHILTYSPYIIYHIVPMIVTTAG